VIHLRADLVPIDGANRMAIEFTPSSAPHLDDSKLIWEIDLFHSIFPPIAALRNKY